MAWLNIAILLLGGICVIAAIVAILAGLQARGGITSAAYGVGRQESRRVMQVAFFRAAVFGILALILFGVYGLSAAPDDMLSTEPEPAATFDPEETATTRPTRATATVAVTETAEAPPPAAATTTPASTEQVPGEPTATATVASTPTITPTSVPMAIVNSEVGLYLRPEPGSDLEVELLPNGTQLILLGEQETVDDVQWQQVRAPSGNEGWVAVEFITYQQ